MAQRRALKIVTMALVAAMASSTAGNAEDSTPPRLSPSGGIVLRAPESIFPEHAEAVRTLTLRFPDLTEEEALDRVFGQERRALLLEEIGSVVSSEFGGSWYDPVANVQHLAVTSSRAFAAAASIAHLHKIPVRMHYVRYGYSDLRTVSTSLVEGLQGDIPSVTNEIGSVRVDIPLNKVEVTLILPPKYNLLQRRFVMFLGISSRLTLRTLLKRN